MFSITVPVNRWVSCSTMPREERRAFFSMDLMSMAVVEDLTLLDVVEAVDQVGDGGLTGAGRTDESDLLARTAVEVDVVQDDLARHRSRSPHP